jgi:hypothetical protein
MNFESAAFGMITEQVDREGLFQNLVSFGMPFLDHSLEGILPNDLIVIGAYSGAGKTQFCVNMALQNLRLGKKVHFIALEAEPKEIERRLKYQMISDWYYLKHPLERPKVDGRDLSYIPWRVGKWEEVLAPGYSEIEKFYSTFEDLYTLYPETAFDITSLISTLDSLKGQTDLIILDHVHYIDYDSDQENKALKLIAKVSKELANQNSTPIVLVAHLRKKDRYSGELVPGRDEFHGSSDLTKAATKVITFAKNGIEEGKKHISKTLVRSAKIRIDGSMEHYVAENYFDYRKQKYAKSYSIGKLVNGGKEFEYLTLPDLPDWAEKES